MGRNTMSNEIRELRNRTNLSQTKFAEYFDIPVGISFYTFQTLCLSLADDTLPWFIF